MPPLYPKDAANVTQRFPVSLFSAAARLMFTFGLVMFAHPATSWEKCQAAELDQANQFFICK